MNSDRPVAAPGTTVRLKYTIRLDNGRACPPLAPDEVTELELGRGRVLPGFERAVLGMRPGETRRVRVPAAECGGAPRPEKLIRIARNAPSLKNKELSLGLAVRVRGPEGDFNAVVLRIDEDSVLLDANHPLCGEDLTFEIEMIDVFARSRPARCVPQEVA